MFCSRSRGRAGTRNEDDPTFRFYRSERLGLSKKQENPPSGIQSPRREHIAIPSLESPRCVHAWRFVSRS